MTNLSGPHVFVPTALPKATSGDAEISQGVSQGLLINGCSRRYHKNALAMRVQGAVELQATINKEGNILHLKVVRETPCWRAQHRGGPQWRYKPYYLNGER